jgi:GNAT superfamily N-acetyltransferase
MCIACFLSRRSFGARPCAGPRVALQCRTEVAAMHASPKLRIHPLTPRRWPDLVKLFGPRGACGGCWCMWWRLPRAEWERRKGAGNKRALKRLVEAGEVPGLLAYAGREPVAWCALAPRERYPVLGRSRVLAPVDGKPVWSVVCFFVARAWRKRGVTSQLLAAAVAYARKRGARIVEGYPVVARRGEMPAAFAYTGFPSAFRRAGFAEVARRSPVRPIMRRRLEGN